MNPTKPPAPRKRGFRLFSPILLGATLPERLLASGGAVVAVALTGVISALVTGRAADVGFLVAQTGASAVLLFAIPSSPLAQPWPAIGGSIISALVGVAVAQLVPNDMIASGLAVGLAVVAMSLCRCLHPPGGGGAIIPVLGGPEVTAAGFGFAFIPVGLNLLVLTLLAVAFHRLSRRSYPHRAPPLPVNVRGTRDLPPLIRIGFNDGDVDAAIADLGETLDINRDDLTRLVRGVERRALQRRQEPLSAADIMSRDVVRVGPQTGADAVRALLLERGFRMLPVVDAQQRVLGQIGLRELTRPGNEAGALATPATIVQARAPVADLVEPLTSGRIHAVVVADAEGKLLGVVTQTDLLAALVQPQR